MKSSFEIFKERIDEISMKWSTPQTLFNAKLLCEVIDIQLAEKTRFSAGPCDSCGSLGFLLIYKGQEWCYGCCPFDYSAAFRRKKKNKS